MRRLMGLAVLAVLATGCGGGESAPTLPPHRYVAVARSLEGSTQFFAEPVVARVEVVLDRRHLDPARVRLVPRIFPYRRYTGVRVHRSDLGHYTRLSYEVGLRCISYPCLPERVDYPGGTPYRDQRVTRFKPWHVYYDGRGKVKTRSLARVFWPSLAAVSNLDLTDPSIASPLVPGHATVDALPPITYRISPPLLAALLLLAAAALLVFPGARAVRWLAGRRLPPEPEPALPPLERALRLVEWSYARVDGEDRRKALEEVAFQLDAAGRGQLAGSARQLAWSPGSPSPSAADDLVRQVRRDG